MLDNFSRGFTLVELMITMTIIAILTIAFLPYYQNVTVRAELSKAPDVMISVIQEAKNLAVSGYKMKAQDDQPVGIGIFLQKSNTEVTIFPITLNLIKEKKLSDVFYLATTSPLKKISLGRIAIHSIKDSLGSEIDQTVILFLPPFGETSILQTHQWGIINDLQLSIGFKDQENSETTQRRFMSFSSITARMKIDSMSLNTNANLNVITE